MVVEYSLTAATERVGAMWRARIASLTVTNAMERDRSWVLPGWLTLAVLNHEQKHFDLAEAYRRLLASLLDGLVETSATEAGARTSLLARAETVFRQVSDRHSAAQAQYDRETDHGRDPARQAEWDQRIAVWLLNPHLLP